MDITVNGEMSATSGGGSARDRLHDAQGWVIGSSLPSALARGGFHGPGGDVPILDPDDNLGIENYFYSLFEHLPETQAEISLSEAAFNFTSNLPELLATPFSGDGETISRVYETGTGDYFIDRDGDGAIDGHFTIDYDQMILSSDLNNDHVAEYSYHLI